MNTLALVVPILSLATAALAAERATTPAPAASTALAAPRAAIPGALCAARVADVADVSDVAAAPSPAALTDSAAVDAKAGSGAVADKTSPKVASALLDRLAALGLRRDQLLDDVAVLRAPDARERLKKLGFENPFPDEFYLWPGRGSLPFTGQAVRFYGERGARLFTRVGEDKQSVAVDRHGNVSNSGVYAGWADGKPPFGPDAQLPVEGKISLPTGEWPRHGRFFGPDDGPAGF